MRILVCIKQVPDPDCPLEPDLAEGGLASAGGRYLLNSYDAFALELALRMKDAFPQTFVQAATVGPDRAEAVCRRALAMGCDGAWHGITAQDASASHGQIAAALAEYAGQGGFDLVLAGVWAQDDQAGCVGPMLAALLKIPCIGCALDCTVDFAGTKEGQKVFNILQEGEGGHLCRLEANAPALVTVQSSKLTPRYPTLTNMLRAGRQKIEFSMIEPRCDKAETVLEIKEPVVLASAHFFEGSLLQKAQGLFDLCRERGLL
ncbi:MAG: electron transfer flavoprotein subunit beta/FixA family protein [Desulfatibacillaceae bacterium]|nr:electron transfer flavoprotein subunit beta/FixA family protein [Desulfatibacillaceae bacterium]